MQKIIPFLWFDKNCEEAMNFYVSVFDDAKVISIKRYPDEAVPGLPMNGLEGKVLTAVFQLEGQRFMALDGGPVFKFNPSVSFVINCATVEEADTYWNKLVEGASVMMPIQKYPFSERYGWLADKFGVSWQIGVMAERKDKIFPAFMFVGDNFGKAEEAINFYTSTFDDSSIKMISRYEEGEHDVPGKVKFASFELAGQQFSAMESSLGHKFDAGGAISLYVECKDQEEIEKYWSKLSDGGDPKFQQCGWLADKYGFSWQIIPKALGEYLSDPDKEKSNRVLQEMLKMKKIVIADLDKAANQ